jgi:hypothetical protein
MVRGPLKKPESSTSERFASACWNWMPLSSNG